ncbi:MAG: acyltransferase [Ruminococcaceae bacterium]|nr:acyltransferase [Oscillospiraceae bacterium]
MTNNKLLSRVNGRYGSCDLLRFVFSLLIMAHHIYQIGFVNAPFHAALIYVEFFFMISGFFMIQHFENLHSSVSIESSAKEAFKYTFRKYKSLMFYVVPCILLEYLLRIVSCLVSSGGISQIGKILTNLPLELLMIAPLTSTRFLPPIWYISAMLIAMPLLCFLYLRFKEVFAYLLSWFVPVLIFVTRGGVFPSADGFDAIMRAYCYLSVGCFLYFVASRLSEVYISAKTRFLLTIVELFCFGSTIVLTALNRVDKFNIIVVLLGIGVLIMLSGCSYSIKLQGKFLSYLGKISLPVYTIHWSVGTFIWLCKSFLESKGYGLPLSVRIVLYYSITIIASILFSFIVDKVKAKSKKN